LETIESHFPLEIRIAAGRQQGGGPCSSQTEKPGRRAVQNSGGAAGRRAKLAAAFQTRSDFYLETILLCGLLHNHYFVIFKLTTIKNVC
jgi:hypothetical protein